MDSRVLYSAVVGLSVGLYGCNRPSRPESIAPTTSSAAPGVHEKDAAHAHGGDGEQGHDGQMDHADMHETMAGLAELSPDDRASAERQHICPVSGEMLGMMGPPLEIDVNGQQVWICCNDCKDELLAHPDKYLAKLKEARSRE